MLVGHLPDELLDDVLQRDDARRAAVLVDHDGHLRAAAAQLDEQRAEVLAAMSDVSRALSRRLSPAGWALNLHEELVRRREAGGRRLG